MFFLPALIAFFPLVHNAQEIADWLPLTESSIEATSEASLSTFQQGLNRFLAIPEEERTFDNTIRAWDFLSGGLTQARSCLGAILQVHPEKNGRDCADKAAQKLGQTLLDALTAHPEIYSACLKAKGAANEEERYYQNHLLFDFKLAGMELPDEQRALFGKVQQEIMALESLFSRQISESSPTFYAPKEALAGLEEDWIAARERNEEGFYRLSCDLPTMNALLNQCSVRETRKTMYELFTNRAFPANEEVIKQLIAKRDTLAKFLGFSNFADYSLCTQMAKSPERVRAFLKQVKEKAAILSALQFKKITENLPESVLLSPANQLDRFDEVFAYSSYQKNHFSVNQSEIAEYFPMDKTIQGLIGIYEQFFNLSIQVAPHSIQIPDLKALELRDKGGNLIGIILLDLFPREGKCSHSGVHFSLVSPYSPPQGPNFPTVSLIVCNFTKPTPDRPSLMTHTEVTTFFHEFGHAIHNVLGRNQFWFFCGTKVKRDFVELPSQLLEEWLWDPEILKFISSHYLTSKPLSDELIQNMIRARAFGLANKIQRSCYYSDLALAFFDEGENKNPTQLSHQLWAEDLPHCRCAPNDHFHASWWHVSSYGPRYYSYLWSQVFALDVFNKIHREGLLNPAAGANYAQSILGKGGGRDPNQLLVDFLEREPSLEPFFSKLNEMGTLYQVYKD